ncbi:MAG: site-specific DNA-methyltransferase [Zoogloea sp.]|nr:site-specific DNA-methyltransferase [Zoogloea sp.]
MVDHLKLAGATDSGAQIIDGVRMPTEIKLRLVAELLPYAKNSRKHSPAQIEALARSMQGPAGFTNPVIIADDGILAGHGRILAANKLGLKRVPTIDLSHLDEDGRRAYVIWDNRSAEIGGGYDLEMLKAETDYLRSAGFDLEAELGFSEQDLAQMFEGMVEPELPGAAADPDAVPNTPDVAVSMVGDIWVCGPHRVACGDSLSQELWDRLMQGELADLCITDPPYNVAYESKLAGKIKNDDMGDKEFREFLRGAYDTAFACMKPGAPIYVAHADTEGLNFRSEFRAAGFKLSGCLIWRKNSLVLGRSDYQWQHEPILYGWKPGAAHRWYGGRKRTTVVEYGEHGPVRRLEDGRWAITVGDSVLVVDGQATIEEMPGSVVYHDKPSRSELHPTTKPVGLWEKLMKPSSRPGDIVIDQFSGSGTTLIAADRMGLIARVCDLDPKFVDVAVRRWEMLTGRKAVHAVTGEPFPAEGALRVNVEAVTAPVAPTTAETGDPF